MLKLVNMEVGCKGEWGNDAIGGVGGDLHGSLHNLKEAVHIDKNRKNSNNSKFLG